jgi:tetratricopeptide (TPR) repeat protein
MEVLKEVPEELKPEIAENLAARFQGKGDFGLAIDVMQTLLGEKVNQNIVYWDVMISQALEEDSGTQAIEVLRDAVAANPENSELRTSLARRYSSILSIRNEFASALAACKIWFGEKYDRDTTTLNDLAYNRALAAVELDQALIDINEALGYRPEAPDLRDTRAWVYFQLGRYEEALLDADFSVKAAERPSLSNWLLSFAGAPESLPPPEDNPTLNK